MTTLIIVESPNKIKTIEKILNNISTKKYNIIATYGHILDLDPESYGIDENYNPTYKICKGKNNVVKNIESSYKKCADIILATDKDREGEMISWSIEYILGIENTKRMLFTSITEHDIKLGLENTTFINQNIINSQKCRRILDRIIGYKLSPLMQKIISGHKISVGRVQSVIVKLIVEKENEVNECLLNAKSHFNIIGFINNDKIFLYFNNNILQFNEFNNDLSNLLFSLHTSTFIIHNIELTTRKQSPPEPYTTSSMQQYLCNKSGWNSKKTMLVAQHLYEKGLITYMRTDSTKLSNDAICNIKSYINNKYGEDFINPIIKHKKEKNIQGAHECIRPTYIKMHSLEGDELYLYTLIFNRTIAYLMKPAIYNVNTITINTSIKDYTFIWKTESILELGYLILYNTQITEQNNLYKINDCVVINNIHAQEKYNNIVHRYNEGSLINQLDPKNLNIGRPSTYATFIEKIQDKQYVIKKDITGITKQIKKIYIKENKINIDDEEIKLGVDNNKLCPTDLGIEIVKYTEKYFPEIMDYKFTSNMECQLDLIDDNKINYLEILKNFDGLITNEINNIKIEKSENIIKEFDDIKVCKSIKGLFIKYNKKIITIPDKYNENITLEQINELLKYPKVIGKYERKTIKLHEGKFGFYIKYDKQNIKLPDKYNPEQFSLNDFMNIMNEKKQSILWEHNDNDINYTIQKGPYGFYISVKNKKSKKKPFNKKLPDKYDINTISFEQIKEILNKKTKRFYKKK